MRIRHHAGARAAALATLMVLACALDACAGPVTVHEVAGGGPGTRIYQLDGDTLAGLDAVAVKACPAGHVVLRRWQGGDMTDPTANIADRVWFQAQRVVGETNVRAQITVQCTPVAAPG